MYCFIYRMPYTFDMFLRVNWTGTRILRFEDDLKEAQEHTRSRELLNEVGEWMKVALTEELSPNCMKNELHYFLSTYMIVSIQGTDGPLF